MSASFGLERLTTVDVHWLDRMRMTGVASKHLSDGIGFEHKVRRCVQMFSWSLHLEGHVV